MSQNGIPNQILGSPQTEIHFKEPAGVFVSLFHATHKLAFCFFLRESDIKSQFEKLFLELQKKFQSGNDISLKDLQLKALGTPKAIKELKVFESKWAEAHDVKLNERNQSSFAFSFFPAEGRIRLEHNEVSKAQKTPVATHPEKKTELKPKVESMPTHQKPRGKVKVLIVDDSPTIRKLLTQVFSRDPSMEVVAAAELPSQVEGLINKHSPDVITLDIHMPEMNGVELLKKIYPIYQIPSVMITSISMEEGPLVLEALESGAVDYIQKPTLDQLETMIPVIIEKVKIAAEVRPKRELFSKKLLEKAKGPSALDLNRVIVIGSSTGGTEALKEVFIRMPEKIPPILVVQHIPPVFSEAFAKRLNDLCPFRVKEGADGDLVEANSVYIAPGGKQMKVKGKGSQARIVITDDAPMNRHKPSVDYLFDSILPAFGKSTIGVILTGMGADGAKGLKKLRDGGCETIAQDEKSSVVFGMPKEAIKLGAASQVKSLLEIPEALCELLERKGKAA